MWQERLSEFVTLFIVVNPFSALPMFLAVTQGFDAPTRRRVALIAVLVSFGVLVCFIIGGGFVLEKMGISLRSFQIAGGIILFLVALDMVRGASYAPPTAANADQASSVAIYPLAIPKLAGPGTMLTVVLLTDDHRFDVVQLSLTTAVLAVVLIVTLLVLSLAAPIARLIGDAGISIISRVMGMILVALAVHTVLSALGSWLNLPPL
ncbi:MAG: MarC family protein [Alphaproteobacteria bacterium]|nr:MAG: MarC family protein [Alphaproteobacteria bacterium]